MAARMISKKLLHFLRPLYRVQKRRKEAIISTMGTTIDNNKKKEDSGDRSMS